MARVLRLALFCAAMLLPFLGFAASDVPVSADCTPAVNQRLGDLLRSHISQPVDNVMVCGTTVSPSHTQKGGRHGNYEILPLAVHLPDCSLRLVEVVTNDDLDGVVTAPEGAVAFAYGQAFFPSRGPFVAGIHDVHCATHASADNGWVVVNGTKSPPSCASGRGR